MVPLIYLICGVPGSGKTWVCNHFENREHYDHHFNTPRQAYSQKLVDRAKVLAPEPLIADAPLGISEIIECIRIQGIKVVPIFVIQAPEVTKSQYESRTGRPIPKQHLGRIPTMYKRAAEYGAFHGTSDQVLTHLYKLLNKSIL